MNGNQGPLNTLNNIFGVNVADVQALKDVFCKYANDNKGLPVSTQIYVPQDIHEKCLRLYHLSLDLVDALRDVMEDGEHQIVMEEAQTLGYQLPDIELFKAELEAYGDFLYGINAYQGTLSKNGYIKVPGDYAELFHGVMHYNCVMVGRIFSGCFETEYMRRFGDLKQAGFAYAGPVALQQALNVLTDMARVARDINDNLQNVRHRLDISHLKM